MALEMFLGLLLGLFHHLSLRNFLTVLFPEVEQAEHRGRGCRFLWFFLFVGLGFLNGLLFRFNSIMLFRFLRFVFLFYDYRILNGYALIQRIVEIVADVCQYQLAHVRSNAVHAALMDILHSRFAVGIGASLC